MMKDQAQNINKVKANLIADINVGSIVESFQPTSTQGIQLKKDLVSYVNEGLLNYVQNISTAIGRFDQLKHVDNNAFIVAEQLSEKLESSIKYHVLFCLEQLQGMRSNALIENAKKFLNEALLLEDEEIKNQLRSGMLNVGKTLPVVEGLIKAANIKIDDKLEKTNEHFAYNPVSYVEQVDENIFIRIGNQVLAVNEHNVLNVKSPSSKFAFISTIVESLKWNSSHDEFSVTHPMYGKFTINESYIARQKVGSDVVTESSASELANEFGILLESLSNKNANEAKHASQFIDGIITLHENFENLAILDNCVVVENKRTHEKFALIVNENATYFSVLKSSRFPNVMEKFSHINEGIEKMKQRSGYDASHFFSKNIEVFENKIKSDISKVNACNLIIESLEAKHREVVELISEEKYSENPSSEKINKLRETATKINALIIEQQNNIQASLQINS